MPVYVDELDAVKDYIKRYIQSENVSIDPYSLSEWVYGYISNDMMEENNPEVLEMIEITKKNFPDIPIVEVVTILSTVMFESYERNYKEWSLKYSQEQ